MKETRLMLLVLAGLVIVFAYAAGLGAFLAWAEHGAHARWIAAAAAWVAWPMAAVPGLVVALKLNGSVWSRISVGLFAFVLCVALTGYIGISIACGVYGACL